MNLKLVIGLGIAAGIVGIFVMRKGTEAAKKLATETLNPASDKNAAYQGANAVVSQIAGRPETVGGWLASVTGADQDQRIADMLAGIKRTTDANAQLSTAFGSASANGQTYTFGM